MRLEGEKLGHYELSSFIQGGGMGEVYLAEDLTISRQVAIKVMKTEPALYPDAQASKDAARLFEREMRAISMLDHAHILTLHEAGEQRINHENITYMVMPYCPEGSLTDWIRRYHSDTPLSPKEVAHILQQAADALQYAHDQQILHLDVKPANFLVRRQQDPSQLPNLLLADFGVAKIATTSKLSATPRGTFDYMAPEQLAGTPVAASDQYALGIMVYELLTGRTPFQGALPQVAFYQHANVMPEPPSTVNPSVASTLDAIVLQALTKKPQDRFASVKEFASAFAGALKPSTKQSHKMQEPPLRQKPVDTQPRQQISLQMQPPPPQPYQLQQKGLLSPQAYEFSTTYQLGTPLEEFRIVQKAGFVAIGLFTLIPVLLYASRFVMETASYGFYIGNLLSSIISPYIIFIWPSIYYLFYPRFHRSWRVYLYSDGFIYTHGKKVDVCPWNQIRKAERDQKSLRYIIIRRDSKKIVLRSIFQSIEYLGDYIIREYERVNRP